MSDNPLKPKVIPSALNPTGHTPNNDAELGKARVTHAEELEWLNRLVGNEDFQRFVKNIKAESNTARRKIRDIDSIAHLTVEQRAAYGQTLALQLDLAEWAELRIAYCVENIKAIDDQRKLQS